MKFCDIHNTKFLILLTVFFFYSPKIFAVVLWTEDWEESSAIITSPDRWGFSSSNSANWPNSGNPSVSSQRAFSGGKSLKHVFTGHQPDHISGGFTTSPMGSSLGGGSYMSRKFTPSDEIWATYYEFMESGFIIDEIGTKVLQFGDDARPHWWVYMWGPENMNSNMNAGKGNLEYSCQRCKPKNTPLGETWANGSTAQYYNNGSFTMLDNTWVCFELHMKYNTPGAADGAVEAYATNMSTNSTVKFMGNYNLEMRGARTTDPVPSNAKFDFVKEYVQDGKGILYRDKLTISTTRVGCSGTPPADPPPPAKPRSPTRLRILN